MTKLVALHRHPVKGLSPEVIWQASLEAGGYFPGDRLFAFENGPSGFDPGAPVHQPKIKFLMLMCHEVLAGFDARFEDSTRLLTIARAGEVQVQGHVDQPAGREALERFFAAALAGALRGPLRLLRAPERFRFTDSPQGFVSLLNLATLRAIDAVVERPPAAAPAAAAALDARRFRCNLHLDGLDAFAENELVGKTIRIGEVELEILARIPRCAATDVNPVTAGRDLAMVAVLERHYGHHDCGLYARIITAGTIHPGLAVEILG